MNKFYWDTSLHSLLPAILSSFFCLHTNGIIFGVALVSKTIFCMLHNIISRQSRNIYAIYGHCNSTKSRVWYENMPTLPPPHNFIVIYRFWNSSENPRKSILCFSANTIVPCPPIPQIMHNRFVYILRLCKIRNHHHRTGDFRFVADGR